MAWEQDLLQALSAPSGSARLVRALQLWAASEGMPASENNWLATTEPGYGGRVVNSAGVRAYPTVAQGVAATAATLFSGNYPQVVDAFRRDASLSVIWQAVNSSPWCGGCQNGLYPVALWDVIKAGGQTRPASPGPGKAGGGGAPSGGGPGGPPAEPRAHLDPGTDQAWSNLRYRTGPAISYQLRQLAAAVTRTRSARK